MPSSEPINSEKYQPSLIEQKWQVKWDELGVFKTPENSAGQPKKYILDMFPYPSGAGLHVGHPKGYIGTDVQARYWRARGYQVLHPMGWDAFGLPAENYAIKTGVHPADSTATNIANYRQQLKAIGLSYDWSREISTCDPEYYRWTQWLFGVLYQQNLAYRQKAKVNWCPGCQTVLANEQVIDGRCERSGDLVEQKDLEQWFFKITAYAEELLSDLDQLDWPESIKQMQRNWIGKSEGALLDFVVQGQTEKITVFTTRPDTLMGVTYLVLAPEHDLVSKITTAEKKIEVEKYIQATKLKTELERQENKQKTGVFTGATVIHPITKNEIPVWVADYVLAGYGTGAVMAVPAHDERDAAFAKIHNLKSIEVLQPEVTDQIPGQPIKIQSIAGEIFTGEGYLINSGEYTGLSSLEAKKTLTAAAGGKLTTTYRLRDWLVSRQRYWGTPIPILYDENNQAHLVPAEQLPVTLPRDVDFKPTGESPLKLSAEFNTLPAEYAGWRREADTMDTFVCSSWYFLRFTDPKNSAQAFSPEAIAQWLPVDLYVGGAEHAVLHLLFARFVTKALRDAKVLNFSEPFLALRNQGLIIAEDGRKMSKSYGNVINPDAIIAEYGADTFRTYEMFMGPFEDAMPWSTKNIIGIKRFLDKVWRLISIIPSGDNSLAFDRILHRTIKKITEDIENFHYNTAISALMILVNTGLEEKNISDQNKKIVLQLLAPFAPHLAEELWSKFSTTDLICHQAWPKYQSELLIEDLVNIAVQFAGKVRGTINLSPQATEEEALDLAKKQPILAKYWPEKVNKVIYIPGRILNII